MSEKKSASESLSTLQQVEIIGVAGIFGAIAGIAANRLYNRYKDDPSAEAEFVEENPSDNS